MLTLGRIKLIIVESDKCRHSQVDKKTLHVIQDLSYRHWDRNTCSNTYELWWQNGTFPGFRNGLGMPGDFLTTATFIVYQFYSIYNETSK